MGASNSKAKKKRENAKPNFQINEGTEINPQSRNPNKTSRDFYVQTNQTNVCIKRLKDDLNGNPFNINNIKNSTIIVEDFCDSMTIDNCENCKFFLSAIRGSVFARTCKNSSFLVVCGQFRCVNCEKCTFLLHSKTSPVIESSKKIKIGCCILGYNDLADNMTKANLDLIVNKWYDVHDFTPQKGNFELCDKIKVDEFYEQEMVVLPFTILPKPMNSKRCVVKISNDKLNDVIALSNSNHIFSKFEYSANSDGINCFIEGQSRSFIEQLFTDLSPISISMS